MKLKRQQQGLTFLGLIIVGVLLALAGLVAAQVFPTYLEYVAVQKAVTKASAGNTVAEVRDIFDKAAAIDDIRTINGRDLTVGKEGDQVVVYPLKAGDIFHAEDGDEHVAHPIGAARILVIEREGSV